MIDHDNDWIAGTDERMPDDNNCGEQDDAAVRRAEIKESELDAYKDAMMEDDYNDDPPIKLKKCTRVCADCGRYEGEVTMRGSNCCWECHP